MGYPRKSGLSGPKNPFYDPNKYLLASNMITVILGNTEHNLLDCSQNLCMVG